MNENLEGYMGSNSFLEDSYAKELRPQLPEQKLGCLF